MQQLSSEEFETVCCVEWHGTAIWQCHSRTGVFGVRKFVVGFVDEIVVGKDVDRKLRYKVDAFDHDDSLAFVGVDTHFDGANAVNWNELPVCCPDWVHLFSL